MQDTGGKTLYYLMSPYSHPDAGVREERFREALKASAWLMNHGFIVFSPISHTHPIAVHHTLPTDWQYWKTQDSVICSRCDAGLILLIDGWDKSTGVAAERKLFEDAGKKVLGMEEVNGGYLFVEVPA